MDRHIKLVTDKETSKLLKRLNAEIEGAIRNVGGNSDVINGINKLNHQQKKFLKNIDNHSIKIEQTNSVIKEIKEIIDEVKNFEKPFIRIKQLITDKSCKVSDNISDEIKRDSKQSLEISNQIQTVSNENHEMLSQIQNSLLKLTENQEKLLERVNSIEGNQKRPWYKKL